MNIWQRVKALEDAVVQIQSGVSSVRAMVENHGGMIQDLNNRIIGLEARVRQLEEGN